MQPDQKKKHKLANMHVTDTKTIELRICMDYQQKHHHNKDMIFMVTYHFKIFQLDIAYLSLQNFNQYM